MHPLVRKRRLGSTEDAGVAPERSAELQEQLESLLDAVWRCEREWRLDDRIALASRVR